MLFKERHYLLEKILWDLRHQDLYLASLNTGENITQANIADAAGVTEVTIRNRVKDLKKQLLQNNNNNNKKIQGYFTN